MIIKPESKVYKNTTTNTDQLTMKEPIAYLLKKLLQKSNIGINDQELEFQILSHPTYPSLHSVTGVLDHFSIKNYALEVPTNAETLDLLPSAFLVLVEGINHNGYALACKHDQEIELTLDSNKKQMVSIPIFLEIWTGIVVIIEEENRETISEPRRVSVKKIALFIAVALLPVIFFIQQPNLFQAIHFILALVGVAICVLIVQHELGIHSKILDRFCSAESKTSSCDAVMNSKGATLFAGLKFSDIGIIYFVSITLTWLLFVSTNTAYNSIIVVTLLALPFTIYSIYYQYRVVRKWCPLCLSVVSVLWLQGVSLLFTTINASTLTVTSRNEALIAFCFIATYAAWQVIWPLLIKERDLDLLKIEHYRFKRSFNIFKSLLNRSETINTQLNARDEIVLGNSTENALLDIVVITNPLCGFCKEAHQLVNKLLERNDDATRITIRFNVSDNIGGEDRKIALRLIEIYNKAGDTACVLALNDIYGTLSPVAWLQKWEEPSELYAEIVEMQRNWCKAHNLNFTPEILVNGQSLPKEYKREELLFFVDELIEEGTTSETDRQTAELEAGANSLHR